MTGHKKSKSTDTKKSKLLKPEDIRLWKKVADTTTPLSGKRGQILQDEMGRLLKATSAAPLISKMPEQPLVAPPEIAPPSKPQSKNFSADNPIDKSTLRKLGRGSRSVDARIDLHGMTQDRVRYALLDFLQISQRAGHRIVLVITGKGNEGRGVLRENVPRWLSLPGFVQLVNGYEQAHGNRGGEGALYVRLRRFKGMQV